MGSGEEPGLVVLSGVAAAEVGFDAPWSSWSSSTLPVRGKRLLPDKWGFFACSDTEALGGLPGFGVRGSASGGHRPAGFPCSPKPRCGDVPAAWLQPVAFPPAPQKWRTMGDAYLRDVFEAEKGGVQGASALEASSSEAALGAAVLCCSPG